MEEKFYWGGATAANQFEGSVFEGGAGLSTADVMTNGAHGIPRQVTWKKKDGTTGSTPLCFHSPERDLPEGAEACLLDDEKYYYPSHIASDFYHHYEEDIKMCAEEGFTCFRLSIKWSRIFPNGDDEVVNEEGIDFYNRVIDTCLKYNMEPLITLSHYETPLALANKYNGWYSRDLIDMFVRYAGVCFERFKGKVKYYLTFNEINCIEDAPFVCAGLIHGSKKNVAIAAYHQFLASSKVVELAHTKYPDLKIGMMLAHGPIYGYTSDPKDQLLARQAEDRILFYSDVQMLGKYPNYKLAEYKREGIELPIMDGDLELLERGTCDFLSFSCYGSHVVTCHNELVSEKGEGNGDVVSVRNPYLATNAWGWATDPDCLRISVNTFFNRYHCPIWCVENGIGWKDEFVNDTVHDTYRIDYMRANIKSLLDARDLDGIPLMGYLYWGCIDMVSNGEGEMAKRYGQIYVDANNYGQGSLKRYYKDSYYWYQKCIKSDGKDLD